MSKELVISSSRHEARVAILEDDQLVEIYFQRANEYSLAGSIHKGRVTRVLPGMQSAFVDLGLERDTFLYVSDFFEENGEDFDRIETKPARQQHTSRSVEPPPAILAPPPEEPEEAVDEPPAVETVSEDAAKAGEPGANPSSGQDRDRRGRRGRRRRTRGRGFPESKYASDLAASSPVAEEPETPAALEEEPAATEVFLLPGESLAKYSRTASDREPSVEEEEEEEAAEALVEERFEAGQVEDTVPVVQAEEEVVPEQTRTRKEPEPAAIEIEAPPEVVASSFPDAAYFATPITAPVEEVAPAEEPEALDGGTPADPEDEAPIEEPPSDSDIEQPPVEDPSGEQPPLQASVREQGNRYQHRSSRRMRRRGRGGDRPDKTGEKPGDKLVEKGAETRSGETREVRSPQPQPRQTEASDDRRSPLPSISELLKEGQEIIVQIAKEPLGQKGARITSHIALPGRYVVYMPTVEHMGVSRKIDSDEERQRLKKILQAHRHGLTGGFIVRTAGEGHTDEEIGADMAYLYNLWLDIRQKAEKKPAPLLLHHDLEIVQRILRDQLSDMYKTIWVDNEDVYESTVRFMQRFQPALVSRVKMYTRSAPIFDAFGITNEIEKALRPKVWLKSGGYIVINQTEALVAIDVNTGKYVGKSNRLEDTITKTNTEAVKEIVRQVRLRDLGGIIVVDFIDMDERKNRQKVMQALEEAMRSDRAPYKILQFNDFGLVAITRKRVKQSLERSLCAPCPTCEGAGYTKSVSTVVGEILQEAVKLRPSIDGKNVVVRTHPDVAKFLKSNSNDFLEELESIVGRPVMVKSDPMLHPEKFDLAV